MIALMIAITIVAGAAPEVSVIQAGMMKITDCERLAVKMNNGPPLQNDDRGRVVMYSEYKCVLLHYTDVDDAIEALKGEL